MNEIQNKLFELLTILKEPLEMALVATQPCLDGELFFMPNLGENNETLDYNLCIKRECYEDHSIYTCETISFKEIISIMSCPSKNFCEFFGLSKEKTGTFNVYNFRASAEKLIELFYSVKDRGFEINTLNAPEYLGAMYNIIQPLYKKKWHARTLCRTAMKTIILTKLEAMKEAEAEMRKELDDLLANEGEE